MGGAALAGLGFGQHADGHAMPATIAVGQETVPIDSPLAVELRGFPPRRLVTVTATETFPSGSRWQAQATFVSDENNRCRASSAAQRQL
jgi:hypothetical protein